MAIVTFVDSAISEITEVTTPTTNAGARYELRPHAAPTAPPPSDPPLLIGGGGPQEARPPRSPPTSVVSVALPLDPPLVTYIATRPVFHYPPNQGPVSNIIVEGPTQRGENNFPSNGISLTRQLPPESNPYRLLPENYIMEQWGEHLPPQYQTEFYNLERPLDLLRYKSDRYWNVLNYAGGYSLPQDEINIIPFTSISYMTVNKSSNRWELRQGSIVNALGGLVRQSMGNTNFLGVFIKETIQLVANYNVFSASAPTAPSLPAESLGGRTYEIDPLDFGVGGGFGGGGYP